MTEVVKIKINHGAVRQLLTGGDIETIMIGLGRKIAAAAGEGVEVSSWVGRNRVRVTVRTATPEAMLDEAKNRTLTRAVGSGRG